VHAFVVPLRDFNTHEILPGRTIGDMGLKPALNGYDNGFLILRNVRVPYDNLLDKLS